MTKAWKVGNVVARRMPSIDERETLRLYVGGRFVILVLTSITNDYSVPSDTLETRSAFISGMDYTPSDCRFLHIDADYNVPSGNLD